MNVSSASSESSIYNEHVAFRTLKICIYVCIFVVSTAGNLLVVIIVARSKRMKASSGNLLIVNLAICDLLTPLFSIPFDLALEERRFKWPFGVVMCKLLFPAATLTSTSSSLTLAVISLDRYRTLMHPFKRRLNTKVVVTLICALHCTSGALVSPYVITLQLTSGSHCSEVWPSEIYPQLYTIALFLGQYVLPLLFMTSMYVLAARNLFGTTQRARSLSICSAMSEGKPSDSNSAFGSVRQVSVRSSLEKTFRKNAEHNAQVTKMFVVIVVVFAVFTLPNEILWIWADFWDGKRHPNFNKMSIICRLFTYSNSFVNPFIFYKFSADFHKRFLALFRLSSSDVDDEMTMKRVSVRVSGSGVSHGLSGRVSPSFLTPRGSLQSTPRHSVCFADQVKGRQHCANDNNLTVDRANKSTNHHHHHHQLNRCSADIRRGSLTSEWIEPISDNQCNIAIRVHMYECDLTIELSNLEALQSLPQTDC